MTINRHMGWDEMDEQLLGENIAKVLVQDDGIEIIEINGTPKS